MHYVGIDWAVDKHDICLLADDGRVLSEFCIANTSAGFEKLRHVLDPLDHVLINIERPNGIIVDWLMSEEFRVSMTPPTIVARRRPRRSKDDRGDAYLLARLLYMKDPDCRPLTPPSPTTIHLGHLLKAYDDILVELRREVVRLVWLLRDYYPQILKAFRVRHTPSFLAFLEAYPTPAEAQALTLNELSRFLRKFKYTDTNRHARIYEALQEDVPQVNAEQGSVEVLGFLIARIRLLTQQRQQLHKRIREVFKSHPDAAWWRGLPGASGPLTAARLLAAMGDNRQRFLSAAMLQATAGTAPITRRSSKYMRVEFRHSCSKTLRRAICDMARLSIKQSGWARAYYHDQLARGHSKPRACRALANRWLAIIWKLWQTGETYDEATHVANRARRGQPVPA